MPSFQLSVTPNRRASARFVERVRRSVQRALAEEPQIRQTDIARALGVHRSVINREIRGQKDITLGRVAELAWALGREPVFDLVPVAPSAGQNHNHPPAGAQGGDAPVAGSSGNKVTLRGLKELEDA